MSLSTFCCCIFGTSIWHTPKAIVGFARVQELEVVLTGLKQVGLAAGKQRVVEQSWPSAEVVAPTAIVVDSRLGLVAVGFVGNTVMEQSLPARRQIESKNQRSLGFEVLVDWIFEIVH